MNVIRRKSVIAQLHHCRCLSSLQKKQTASEYCLELVKKSNYEQFLSAMLLNSELRTVAIALRSFNIEISSIGDVVSEKTIGLMRFQFWQDSLDNIYSKRRVPQNPVAIQLTKCINKFDISKSYLDGLVESRRNLLQKIGFSTYKELDEYCEASVSSLYHIIFECAHEGNSHVKHAGSQLGKAEGLVTLIRSVPRNASRKIVYVPESLLLKHSVSQEKIFRGSNDESVKNLFEELATCAHEHIQNARFRKKYLSKISCHILLPCLTLDSYLSRLHKVNYDVFHSSLQTRDHFLPAVLLFNKYKKNF